MKMHTSKVQRDPKAFLYWLKRIGFWGFLFFLVKGLFWILLTYWLL